MISKMASEMGFWEPSSIFTMSTTIDAAPRQLIIIANWQLLTIYFFSKCKCLYLGHFPSWFFTYIKKIEVYYLIWDSKMAQ